LILGAIPGPEEPQASLAFRVKDSRVVAGGKPEDPELQSGPTEQRELDPRIADNTGIRGPRPAIGLKERLDHLLAEGKAEIDAVERHPELSRQCAYGPRGLGRIVGSEAHVERHHPVTPLPEEEGGDGTVHAAAQCDCHRFVRLQARESQGGLNCSNEGWR